jgi:hypothetical protein
MDAKRAKLEADARLAQLRLELLRAELQKAEADAALASAAVPLSDVAAPGPPPPYSVEYGWHGPPPALSAASATQPATSTTEVPVVKQRPVLLPNTPQMKVPVPKQSAPLPVGLVGGKGASQASGGIGPANSSTTSSIAGDFEMVEPEKQDKPSGWPIVLCNHCGVVREKWTMMISKRDWDEAKEAWGAWDYECFQCVMARTGKSEGEARAFVFENRADFQQKRDKAAAFSKKKAETKALFESLGVSKSGKAIYRLTVTYMAEVFEELSEFILLKCQAHELLVSEMEQAAEIKEELAACTDPARMKELLKLLSQIAKRDTTLAYKGHEQQHDMVRSAAYTDQLSRAKDGRTCRFFFICLGGGQWPCMRMLPSKEWQRKFDTEAWHKGQKWRCTCGTNYRASWGTVVEIIDPRQETVYYWRGSCPDWDTLDVKALHFQKTIQASTPKELYDAIPMCRPALTIMVRHLPTEGNVWQWMDRAALDSLPKWDWEDMQKLATVKA